MKKAKVIAVFALAAALTTGWFLCHCATQEKAIIIPDAIFAAGEAVEIGDNYFNDARENPAGYSITVNSGRCVPITEFFTSKGLDETYIPPVGEGGLPRPEYVYEVELTFTNNGSTEGMIAFYNYLLIDKSILLRVDEILLPLAEPDLEDVGTFRLKDGTSKTFCFPFVPDASTIVADAETLYKRMEQGRFYFCLSQFPTRKLISIFE